MFFSTLTKVQDLPGYAEGDLWVVEQLGQRQDFEAELSRLGFRHEEFTLNVRGASRLGPKPARSSGCAVRVTHIPTHRWTIYTAGPRNDWIARFKEDLAMGVFVERPAPSSEAENADTSRSKDKRLK